MPPRKRPASASNTVGHDCPSDQALHATMRVLHAAYSEQWHSVAHATDPAGVQLRTGLHDVICFLEVSVNIRRPCFARFIVSPTVFKHCPIAYQHRPRRLQPQSFRGRRTL